MAGLYPYNKHMYVLCRHNLYVRTYIHTYIHTYIRTPTLYGEYNVHVRRTCGIFAYRLFSVIGQSSFPMQVCCSQRRCGLHAEEGNFVKENGTVCVVYVKENGVVDYNEMIEV